MARIGVILPYERDELKALFREIGAELGVELRFGTAYLGEAYSVVQGLLAAGPLDGLVARNVTASMIRQRFELPVTNLEVTSFEMLQGCSKLAAHCGRIGYFQFSEVPMYFDREAIQSLVGVEVREIEISREDPAVDYLHLLKEAGCDGLATSSRVIYNHCADAIRAVFLEIGREEIRTALRQALNTIYVRSKERIRTEFIRSVLNSVGDGFVATDERGRISLLNRAMEGILGDSSASLMGTAKAAALARSPFLREVFAAEDGAILSQNGVQYAVNRRDKASGALAMGEFISLTSVSGIQRLESHLRRKLSERGFEAKSTFGSIAGESEAMQTLKAKAAHYAASRSSVLILGESGTGKELFAQGIHNASPYREGPFVAINCAALPDNLLESELFGYEEGAFTGARKGGKVGLVELSHGGTLFLDEISELSVAMQAKLLRILQERCICRVGGDKMIPVDNRVLCAANQDLRRLVQEGRFREDLYYRINVLQLTIPPLKNRGRDIVLIAAGLLRRKSDELGKTITLGQGMEDHLLDYPWPGNIRELENFIERLAVMTGDGEASWETFSALMEELTGQPAAPEAADGRRALRLRPGSMEEIERQVLEETTRRKNGRVGEVCRELGISRTTYWRRMRREPEPPGQ